MAVDRNGSDIVIALNYGAGVGAGVEGRSVQLIR